ncbi:filamentous hemagglutinin N-terminal domain-containing protein [Acaryochloris sp. 'Moss Beach']|uniref:filamentous hemagglutinin N-terminal domain-containing protein n=1 Tax=Acaryochloris sp. 'Moss Beach' TaxID=2740837 RepID=UPI002102A954|nr:filamentous hemagglutinin N-terminal domain-containing protein [Acaryochloris sp. 'Moss Beach']
MQLFFNNSANIRNIISRVTGNSASNIDGILKANGSANLFFINPNGIVFGENARLDIGGSFLGTTANRINFADGTQFSAIAPQVVPGLTNAEPVGVDFGFNSGEIRVTNTGHQIPNGLFLPSLRDDNPPGLQVSPGKTLALVGGDIVFDGGAVYTPGGQLEIGSVEVGTVTFSAANPRWTLNYDDPNLTFKNILFQNRSLLDTTGQGNASIGIYGRQINFLEKSIALMQNQGVVPDKKTEIGSNGITKFCRYSRSRQRPIH